MSTIGTEPLALLIFELINIVYGDWFWVQNANVLEIFKPATFLIGGGGN